MKDKNNLEPSDYVIRGFNTIDGLKPTYDILYIFAKRTVIKDKELGIEIDLKGKIQQINKIVIDGITFVKENKNESNND